MFSWTVGKRFGDIGDVISSCSHCFSTIFILTSYTVQVFPVLILIDVEHLQNVVFNLEKSSNCQKHSSGTHHLIKKFPQEIFRETF